MKTFCFSWAYKNIELGGKYVYHWSYGHLKSRENLSLEGETDIWDNFSTVYKRLGKYIKLVITIVSNDWKEYLNFGISYLEQLVFSYI